jgi:C-terminal processing protease CtpA/Prc
VTIDYPRRSLHLQRYTSITIVDEFKRVGVELAAGSGAHRYVVGTVYRGTDAELKQLMAGDEIVSIDGQALDPLDSVTADGLLSGTVGATRAIALGTARAAGLANTTVAVRVDDLIPPP